MSKARKYIIAADINTTAPLHITAIEKGGYNVSTQRILRYEAKGLAGVIGCSLTRTQAIASAMRQTDDGTATFSPLVPVIPASTIAGKLRRAACDLIFESMVARNLRLSPDAYNTMTSGTASTDINTKDATPETMRAARLDPFLGLFGGTSYMVSAGSVIAEGWPLLGMTKDLLMTDPILDVLPFEKLSDMTDAVAIIRKNDVMAMRGDHLESILGVAALADYVKSESDKTATSKGKKGSDDDEGKKTNIQTYNAFEAVRTGMRFALRIEVTAYKPAHLGLMLMAMQSLLRNGQFGGKGARGLGTFVCGASRLYELAPDTRKTTVVSAPFGDKAGGYAFAVENDVVSQSITDAQDYINESNPLLFESFATANSAAIKELQASAK